MYTEDDYIIETGMLFSVYICKYDITSKLTILNYHEISVKTINYTKFIKPKLLFGETCS